MVGIEEGIAAHQEDLQLFDRALTYIEQQGWLTDEAMQDLREHSRFGIGPIQSATNRLGAAGGSYDPLTQHTTYNPERYKLLGEDAHKELANTILHEYGHVLDYDNPPPPSLEPLKWLANNLSAKRVAKELLHLMGVPRPASSGKPGGNITPYAETDPLENFAEVFAEVAKYGSPWGNTQPVSDNRDAVQKHIQPWMVPLFEQVIQNYNKPVASWWGDRTDADPSMRLDPTVGLYGWDQELLSDNEQRRHMEQPQYHYLPITAPAPTQGWTPPLT